jgi:hypothetical protein
VTNAEARPTEDPNFPEAVRVLLHSLHADAGYLAGRVVRNPEDVNLVVKTVREKLEKLELAVRLAISSTRRGYWQRPGPVDSNHPLECLVVLPATRQSDGDWYLGGSKFIGQDDVLAWSDAEKSYPDFCPAPGDKPV